ncbi:uncharacterized protein LOC115631364 [Scaptodrosophila lebanonensis]|uniref:Uncharacterized protein LOC115631364 n=1 Tax=Drosophila lebanonensis TaxID=7225 RepID=A0A6J2U8R7_DROLE|nr:uncharacterized protein LOC115631364 [Scaptodrosophila lebanonensis]
MKFLTRAEKWYRKVAIVGIVLCMLGYSYVYLDYLSDRFFYTTTQLENAYFVNNPGCKIVALDVMNRRISHYMYLLPATKCPNSTWFETKMYGGSWTLELSMNMKLQLEGMDVHCQYWPVTSLSGGSKEIGRAVHFRLEEPYRVTMAHGIRLIRVACLDSSNQTLHQDVHFFVQPPPKLGLRNETLPLILWRQSKTKKIEPTSSRKTTSKKKPLPAAPLISIMILGLDKVSHLNFLRQMPVTAGYIRTQLPHVEFWGYNKVGGDTFLNLMPMLTGMSFEHFHIECGLRKEPSNHLKYDKCDLLWEHFKRRGYNTSYGEDEPVSGVSRQFKSISRAPTFDHYLRPTLIEMNSYCRTFAKLDYIHCSGGREYADVLFEHIERLLPHKQRYPFFSFYWWKQGVFDYFNYPQKLDIRFFKLLRRLSATGVMNNTFILLMSDHGLRWGPFRRTYQGMLEDGLPLLFAIYPAWLKKRYPEALDNLADNDRNLVTTYDLFSTLYDLIDLNKLRPQSLASRADKLRLMRDAVIPRGMTLFLPVSPFRTCKTSRIPADYCVCHGFISLSVSDARAQRAARAIVRIINDNLRPFSQCQYLQLDAVLKAYLYSTQRELSQPYTKNEAEQEVKVRLQTLPGEAQFEATTRFTGFTMALTGDITRINNIHNQSYCTKNPNIRMFCYCKPAPYASNKND